MKTASIWIRKIGLRTLLSGMALAASAVATAAAQDSWPAAAADLNLRAAIESVDYSAEEKRNIRTVLELFSEPRGRETPQRDRFFAKGYRQERSDYFTLDRIWGERGTFTQDSLKSVKRQVRDIIAKGDQIYVVVETVAIHSGPLYGIAGTSEPVMMNERDFFDFDAAGKIRSTTIVTNQGELYRQLGGKMTFPPSADTWVCPKCPRAAGTIAGFTPWKVMKATPQPSDLTKHGANGPNDFFWPTRTTEARVPVSLRKRLMAEKFTAQEHRVVQRAMERTSGVDRNRPAEEWKSKHYHPEVHHGFYVIHEAFGYPARDGWSTDSNDQMRMIERIVAKGNRIAMLSHFTGGVVGPFFGFEGVDQQIDFREFGITEYDSETKVVSQEPWGGDDLALYEQLGGKFGFYEPHLETPVPSTGEAGR